VDSWAEQPDRPSAAAVSKAGTSTTVFFNLVPTGSWPGPVPRLEKPHYLHQA
jgi:hypothetical protein